MTTLYHNPRCSKSRETLQILEEANEPVTLVLYLKEIPTVAQIKNLLAQLHIEAIDLVRKNEAVWKENYKGKELSQEDIILAMHQHPKLIERPIAIKDGKAVLGRPPRNVLSLLGA